MSLVIAPMWLSICGKQVRLYPAGELQVPAAGPAAGRGGVGGAEQQPGDAVAEQVDQADQVGVGDAGACRRW